MHIWLKNKERAQALRDVKSSVVQILHAAGYGSRAGQIFTRTIWLLELQIHTPLWPIAPSIYWAASEPSDRCVEVAVRTWSGTLLFRTCSEAVGISKRTAGRSVFRAVHAISYGARSDQAAVRTVWALLSGSNIPGLKFLRLAIWGHGFTPICANVGGIPFVFDRAGIQPCEQAPREIGLSPQRRNDPPTFSNGR